MTKRTRIRSGRLVMSRPLVALIALLAVAACDDDTVRPAQDNGLTEAEVVALVDGLAAVGGLTGVNAATPAVDPPAIDCPLGGKVDLLRRVIADTVTTPLLVLRSDLVMTPRDCQFEARGVTFTANGAPDVRQVGRIRITGQYEKVELDWEIDGAVDWETGSPARQGTCSLDLDLTGEADVPSAESTDAVVVFRGALSGTACDKTVNLPLNSTSGS